MQQYTVDLEKAVYNMEQKWEKVTSPIPDSNMCCWKTNSGSIIAYHYNGGVVVYTKTSTYLLEKQEGISYFEGKLGKYDTRLTISGMIGRLIYWA
jgi:hypothetical protein